MSRLIQAKCPQCGAGVRLDPQLDWVTCSYCNTSSFVTSPQKQSQHQHVPQHYPVIDISQAVPRSRGIAVVAFGAMLFAAVSVVAIGAYVYYLGSSEPTESLRASSIVVIDGPMLGEANGDGVSDPIVLTQSNRGSETLRHLSAFDAHTGKVLWTGQPIGTSGDQQELAAVGSTALVGKGATLIGVDLRTGTLTWQKPLPEKVDMFCDDGQGGASLVTNDNQVYAVNLKTGELSAKGKQREFYAAPPHTRKDIERRPPRHRKGMEERLARWEAERAAEVFCFPASSGAHWSHGVGIHESKQLKIEVEGMYVATVLREREQGPFVLVGNKQPGTGVPMLAVATAEGELSWKAEVPSINPMGAAEGKPAHVTIAHGRVLTAHHIPADKKLVITAFSLQDGKRFWEQSVPVETVTWIRIAANERYVFLRERWAMYAYALADGRLLWATGK
jgi:outer membrane protein assembly factor BamB